MKSIVAVMRQLEYLAHDCTKKKKKYLAHAIRWTTCIASTTPAFNQSNFQASKLCLRL